MSKQNSFQHTGHYVCECGKEFTKSQSFNTHKITCRIHHEFKGDLNEYEEAKIRKTKKSSETLKLNNEIKRKEKEALNNKLLEFWFYEQHKCERCGKVMTTYYGTGRFCSTSCANSKKHSEETKNKISMGVNKYNLDVAAGLKENAQVVEQRQLKEEYIKNPSFCVICGKELNYKRRNNSTCGKQCTSKLLGLKTSESMKRKGPRNGDSHYKYGVYKGINCDSSWELAFVIYCLDHDTNLKRCNEYFKYLDENGKERMYFPDFLIDGEYYEIKGRITEEFILKKEQFPKDRILNVISYKEIQKYLKYARSEYGENFIELYDEDSPSWMNSNNKRK